MNGSPFISLSLSLSLSLFRFFAVSMSVSSDFHPVDGFLFGFNGCDRVLLGLTSFYWVLLGLLAFTGFYWVLLGFARFC